MVTSVLSPLPLTVLLWDRNCISTSCDLTYLITKIPHIDINFKKSPIISPQRTTVFLYITFQPFHITYVLKREHIFYERCVCVCNMPLSENPFFKEVTALIF